jgi:hypothetical protein
VDILQVRSIKVVGCGIPEVNGIYTRDGLRNVAPKFKLHRKWNGPDATFHLYRSERLEWYILGLMGKPWSTVVKLPTMKMTATYSQQKMDNSLWTEPISKLVAQSFV